MDEYVGMMWLVYFVTGRSWPGQFEISVCVWRWSVYSDADPRGADASETNTRDLFQLVDASTSSEAHVKRGSHAGD